MENIPEVTALAMRADVMKIAKEAGVKNISSYKKELFTGADNQMTITIKYRVEGKDQEKNPKVKQIFGKTVIPKREVAHYLTGIFKREIAVYNSILPKIEEIRASKNVHEASLIYPILYNVCKEASKEYIVLEDMTVKHFSMPYMQREADLKHSRLVLRNMGRLHAYSYVLRDLDRKSYDEFSKKYQWEDYEEMKKAYAECVPRAVKAIKKMSPFSVEVSKFEELVQDYMKVLNEYKLDQYATLNHGSTRINNFMFKYEESDIEKKNPIDVAFIDFQRTHFGSPAHDISYYFCTNTDGKVLGQHFDELIETYLESFKETYDKFEIKDGKVLTKEILEEQMNKYFRRGLILSCTAVWYMLKEEEKYNSRMADVIKFATERKYI